MYPSKFPFEKLGDYTKRLNDYMNEVDQKYVLILDDEAFYKKLSLKTNKLNIKQIEKEACLELYKEYKKLNLSRY